MSDPNQEKWMKKRLLGIGLSAVCGMFFCGCITHQTTVVQDPPRVRVEFENETAARIFYEALSQGHRDERQSETNTKVEIPILFEHTSKVVSGSNVAFNRAVELCDTNKDGKITEMEAKIYAETFAK
jgi:hypothetical protein